MCRFLPPPGRQQNRTQNLIESAVPCVFENRKNFEKNPKNKKVKIRSGIWKSGASGTTTFWQPESPLD